MSKSNSLETAILALLYNATPIPNIADNAASSPATQIAVALHTADPGEGGNQATSEANYTSYARVNVARNSGGWTVSGNSVSPAANIDFPAASGGSNAITHFSTGTGVSNAMLHSGTVTPNLSVSNGVTPRLTTATAITED